MNFSDFFLIWPGNPGLSMFVWVLLTMVVLFLARTYVHRLIKSASRLVHNALRLSARSVMLAEARLVRRNREVVLSSGEEYVERQIERQFHRISNVVMKDLQAYPALQRSMADLVTAIDEDYRQSAEVPPTPPAWLRAVEAVSKIPSSDDTLVVDMLGAVNKSVTKNHKILLDEYRQASSTRHGLLKKMMPYWRKLSHTLESIDKTIKGLLERSQRIDEKMSHYEEILSRSDKAERMLSSSSLTQFFISGLVLLIAFGGAIVNFNLIALPMSEMVGGGTYLGPFKMSNVAALVIILIETATGIYLMESLRITRLFPIIGTMEDRKRKGFMWASFSILLIMALIESSLAFMRDIIVINKQALIQSLAGETETAGPSAMTWIPMVGQMVMGFILPFALAFVAIPFESFVYASRTVLGLVMAWMLRALAFLLRLTGVAVLYAGNIIISVYDLMAFPLLWVEGIVRDKGRPVKDRIKEDTAQ